MRFRRVIILMLSLLSLTLGSTSYASTVYDFTTSESIVINNVPGSCNLNISSMVIENSGPAFSIDSIRAESLNGWTISNDTATKWTDLSADAKAFSLICNSVDLSESSLINQGSVATGESRIFGFTGHIGPRRVGVSGVAIANIITTVTISEEPVGGTTYVYQDGTLIINEPEENHEANVTVHGTAIASYATYEENVTDWDSASNVPWLKAGVKETIENVEFGSSVSPTDMSYWFYGCSNITDIDFTNLDCSSCRGMNHTFDGLSSIEYLDLCGLNTSNVTSMNGIFANCTSLKRIYVDDSWSVAAVTEGSSVIAGSISLIGGDGHVYNATADYTELKYDGHDDPGFLTYNGSDKCVITYNYNKTGYDFDSDFFNQVKSGDNFSCGGAGSQVHNPNEGDMFIIRGFGPSKYSRTVIAYTEAYQSKGSSMIMYAIFLYR